MPSQDAAYDDKFAGGRSPMSATSESGGPVPGAEPVERRSSRQPTRDVPPAAYPHDPVAVFLAKRAGVDPAAIETYKFIASPSQVWSEYTADEFSCTVQFTVNGEQKSDWWNEDDVVEFLNGLVPNA